jgi:tetratricopeptide (TPR) repeat protein
VRSILSVWTASLVESSWLAALVVVPVFYNVYSHETFEPDKVLLLRALTALTLAAGIVWCVESGRAAWTLAGRPVWRIPLALPVCALMATYLLSTACSIAPSLSIWGSYLRAQGAYTWLSYVAVFFAIVLVAREREQWHRIVSAVLLTSLPVAAYAIAQHLNVDPIDWGRSVAARVTGTAGNPIFLGAYLVMVLPLTLSRALAPRRAGLGLAHTAPYWILAALQLAALVATKSRGPTVGFAFGLAAFVTLLALLRRVRWPIFALGGAAAGVVLLAIASTAPPGGAPVRGLGRLSQVFAWQQASGRVRVLIWHGVIDMLRRNPMRAVIGHGPETMLLAFAPVYPAELSTYERPDKAPDRAHNEVMDTLTTTGALGCVAELLLFIAFFSHTLRWLGILTTAARRNWFLAATVGGAIVGGITPVALGHSAFIGLGLSLGLATGVLAYLVILALLGVERVANRADTDTLLLVALFAAGFGHFVELQAGIGISTTRLYFFAFAGLAVAIGMQPTGQTMEDAPAAAAMQPVVIGVIGALLLSLLTVDLYTPTVRFVEYAPPLAAIFLATWVFGFTLINEEEPSWQLRRLGTYAGVSIILWLLFVTVFARWLALTRQLTARATPVDQLGAQLAGAAVLAYSSVFACVALLTVGLAWRRRSAARALRWQAGLAAAPLLVAATVAILASLRVSRADCFAKLGDTYEQQGAWSEAIAAHERALQSAPTRQEYAVNLSRALITRARAIAQRDPVQRDADAARAINLLEETARANPLSPDNASNLARLWGRWARIGDPARRAERLEYAETAYSQALALWPSNPVLWNEVAVLHLERGQPQKMWEAFDHSLALNDQFVETYVRRALVFVALQRFDDATAEYRRARRWPFDPTTLAQLYRETGQVERALAEARAGLADISPQERPALRSLIHLLKSHPK